MSVTKGSSSNSSKKGKFSYKNLMFTNEMSMLIKDDDSKYEFGFNNKAEIGTIGYGSCKKLK